MLTFIFSVDVKSRKDYQREEKQKQMRNLLKQQSKIQKKKQKDNYLVYFRVPTEIVEFQFSSESYSKQRLRVPRTCWLNSRRVSVTRVILSSSSEYLLAAFKAKSERDPLVL